MGEEADSRNGIFTDRLRKYLTGGLDLDGSVERSTRGKVRNRISTLFVELRLLDSDKIDKTERDLILNNRPERYFKVNDKEIKGVDRSELDDYQAWGTPEYFFGFKSLFKFYWQAMREQGRSIQSLANELEYIIETAEGEDRRNTGVEAEVSVHTVRDIDTELAKRRYERGEELTGTEMRALVESGDAEIHLTDE